MLITKLVVRVLDAGGQLLAWTEVQGEARGDGCLRSDRVWPAAVTCTGVPASLSVHWADLNVEVCLPPPAALLRPVSAGEVIALVWTNEPIIRVGQMPQSLAPVTVGSVSVSVPVGKVGS